MTIEHAFIEDAAEILDLHKLAYLSERNLRFYGRLGYKAYATQTISDNLTLVFMEKIRDAD